MLEYFIAHFCKIVYVILRNDVGVYFKAHSD